MHDNSALVEARIARFARERVAPATYRVSAPLDVAAWEVPDEPVPFAEAVSQSFEPFAVGRPWGKPWGTTWFHFTGVVPEEWAVGDDRVELVIDLGFLTGLPGFQAEGLVFRPDGTIVKAIEPFNNHVPLDVRPGEAIDLYVEAASNPDVGSDWSFHPTPVGDKATAGTDPIYALRRADVAVLDVPVWELGRDLWTLVGLMGELEPTTTRRADILHCLERAIDSIDPWNVSATASAGRAVLREALDTPASASAHRIVAVGHAHIDSAWLWPVRETIRKCARTFSNVLQLMDEHPDFIFACSSAQQFAWMKDFYPELFERIRERVIEGRFVPVGGMWVESDTNLPGGEALARQLIVGKGFFMREFGVEPLEVWLPDSFGYSAALPQIVAAAGSRYFLTQKLSWNDTNLMPHSSFDWEGIDGTRVFTHFPPVSTYNSDLSAADLARAERLYGEKGVANLSLVPFGYGDGGGGPTREMLAAAERTRSLDGSPAVRLASPRAFFEEAEAQYPHPPVWSGELYLEFHRGTYTSQARTKQGNRRSEHLLREAELWATTASVRAGIPYPRAELRRAWETVLLQQFHDILPGSSIAWVHRQAEENYAVVRRDLESVIERSLRALVGEGERMLVANASPFPADGVAALAVDVSTPNVAEVAATTEDGGVVIGSSRLRVVIDSDGQITSLFDRQADRELVPAREPANQLQLFRDTPNQWDAWDIDAHYRRTALEVPHASSVDIVESDAGVARVTVTRGLGASTIVQEIVVAGIRPVVDITTSVDWHEKQKLLKLAFPLDVHAARAASEIQFGHVERPTHANTSWDSARFETSAHRWVLVEEPGYGVVVANDATYGHDITRHTRPDGGTTTLVRQSLLRAPLFPDPTADQGEHVLRTAIRVGADTVAAAEEGYRLNLPTRHIAGAHPVAPLVTVDNPGVIVEAVKLAEDDSGDVVVRLYELRGARARADVTIDSARDIIATDLLERAIDAPWLSAAEGRVTLTLRPFQIVTLRAAVTPPGREAAG